MLVSLLQPEYKSCEQSDKGVRMAGLCFPVLIRKDKLKHAKAFCLFLTLVQDEGR